MSEELEEKTRRISDMLAAEGLDAVLLNSQHNFAWLTGGGSNGIDLSRENGAASLLVTADGRRFVLANNIEMPRMLSEEVKSERFEPVVFSWQDEKANADLALMKARERIGQSSTIATDIALFASARPVENKLAPLRYSLTAAETVRLRTLGRDAGVAVRRAIDIFEPGETEIEIAERMRHELTAGGMTSVVTLVAADERIKRFRHPKPTDSHWKKSLLVVTCAKRSGLIVSLSRVICVGEVPDELERITKAAAFVNASLLSATRPGATGAELYETAARAYLATGFADEINKHHQGGAAGYKTREWVAHPASTETVVDAQAFSWNPSITGTKVEETCIVNGDAVEILTRSPDFPEIEVAINGREYVSPGVLRK